MLLVKCLVTHIAERFFRDLTAPAAVKATHDNQKRTEQNIQEIANTVEDLATTKPCHNDSLRLPPANLPTYKGDPTEKLERFLEHFKLQLHDAIYRLRFYSNSLIHILSLSNSYNNLASIQKNRADKSDRVIVALQE